MTCCAICKYAVAFLLLFPTTGIVAQQVETRSHQLDSVAVVGHSYTSGIRNLGGGTIRMDLQMLDALPQILSNADPLRYAQMLPGIQTSSDFDSGLHVYGCDNAHNLFSIDGIPLYNASHLLGLFSTFNPSHFSEMQLSRTANEAWRPNRLGGMVEMCSRAWADTLSADVSVGMLSSQGHLTLPTGPRASLTLSARASYLNFLYRPWLKADGEEFDYRFSDFNLAWSCQPTERDQLLLTAYHGSDRLGLSLVDDTRLTWGNSLTGLTWQHRLADAHFRLQAYFTRYSNRLLSDESAYRFEGSSEVCDMSVNARYERRHLTLAAEYIHHRFEPNDESQQAHETSLSADWRQSCCNDILEVQAGLRLSDYALTTGRRHWLSASPSLQVGYHASYGGTWKLAYSLRHQYVQQTSISQLGLPIEMFFSANEALPPQYAHSLILSHDILLADQQWQLTTELFVKRLFHQTEFVGNGLNLLQDSDFDLFSQIAEGDGHNYGFSMILNRRYGRLTGWMSYTWNRAMRRFPHIGYSFPASHERRHELNLLATYRLSSRLDLSGTFIIADGNPFTAARNLYLLNGRVVAEFGRLNHDRLPAYHRLDLALNWQLGRYRQIFRYLNFSLYNVYCHGNTSFYRYKIYKGRFAYRGLSLLHVALPSVAYSVKF